MERVPLQERPYDVQRFVEAYRLLDDVLELLPEQVLPATGHCSAHCGALLPACHTRSPDLLALGTSWAFHETGGTRGTG
jgi:hypothetical protein